MFTIFRISIKHHFPRLYLAMRKNIFPIVSKLRQRKGVSFTQPCTKVIAIHGVQFKIKIDPANGFVDKTIYTTGVYEPDILQVIKKYLPVGGTFVDIGANIGQHSLFAAAHVGANGKVIAFEPIPRLVTQVQKSIALNNFTDRMTLHTIGCSNKSDTATLHLQPDNIGGSSIHFEKDTVGRKITISLETADTFLSDMQSVNFIKIDTEGHEHEVIQGLTETIEKHHPTILFEYSPTMRSDNRAYRDILTTLVTAGYRLYDLESGDQEINEVVTWADNFTKLQTNLLAVPK